MPMSRKATVVAVALVLGGSRTSVMAQRPDSTLKRPADIILTVSNDPDLSGVYKASGTAIKCGLADYLLPHRNHSFALEYPDRASPTDELSAVTLSIVGVATRGTKVKLVMTIICRPRP